MIRRRGRGEGRNNCDGLSTPNLLNYVKSTMEESGWQVVGGRRRGRRRGQEFWAGVGSRRRGRR